MVIGVAEIVKGIGEVGRGVVATIGSGGTASLVSIPVAVEGVIEIVHGSGFTLSGLLSLKDQKGRVSEMNSNGNSTGGGKNAKHANENARKSAAENYNNAKKQYEELRSKPNKTPEDKKAMEAAKRQMDHWKNKQDFSGENHNQNAKGNR